MDRLIQVILFLNCTRPIREENSEVFNQIVYKIRNNQYQYNELRSDIQQYIEQCQNNDIRERFLYELQQC